MWHKLFEMINEGIKIKISAEIVLSADEKPNVFTANCDECGWTRGYSSSFAMKRGLDTHKSHCEGTVGDKHAIDPNDYQWIDSAN